MFELTNQQRKYFGLEPVLESWDRVLFKGDTYRPDSILYYENDIIKKHVISTNEEYHELQYNEQTQNREYILPKTKRGKAKKLTAAVLSTKTPIGVYLLAQRNGSLIIGNHTSQTTFYSRDWEYRLSNVEIQAIIQEFIDNSPADHLKEIEEFRQAKRTNIKYKAGDFFAFKLNRTEYGFGRILFDVNKARKKKLIENNYGLHLLMGPPLLIKLYAYKSESKSIDIGILKKQKSLPSDYIMDNLVFYGEYQIIGNLPLETDDIEFPISYGMRIDSTQNVFLQWGLINIELPQKVFRKYIMPPNGGLGDHNPYGYYTIGFRPKWDSFDIIDAIENNGDFDYSKGKHFKLEWDLRNPKNEKIKIELFEKFGLDPTKSYLENAEMTEAPNILEMIKQIG